MLAGRVLCDLYSGNHAAWRDMPFYQRPMPRLPPEPLRWLGYQIYTRLTGRSPRRR
jgi:gamma-glutamylputrescine oxidase